jgi:mercuric ion transport protein
MRAADFKLTARGAMVAGVLSAIGASLCCAAPLVLVTLGLGGAWLSRLTALEPLRPLWLALTGLFFVVGGYRLYVRAEDCPPDQVCAAPAVQQRQRIAFWAVGLVALALVAFPWYAEYLF